MLLSGYSNRWRPELWWLGECLVLTVAVCAAGCRAPGERVDGGQAVESRQPVPVVLYPSYAAPGRVLALSPITGVAAETQPPGPVLRAITGVTTEPSKASQLSRPLSLAVRSGRILVCDTGRRQLIEVDPRTDKMRLMEVRGDRGSYRPVAALAAEQYAHQPTKPVILLESHYEGDWAGKSAEDVRRYPYQAVLSGATGHFFGNRPLWFLGHGWEAALNSAGSRYMEHAGRLFRSRPWSLLVPTEPGQLVTAGGGDPHADSGVQSARAADRRFAMAFVPDSRTIDVDLRQLSGSTVRAWWFDVATGAATAVGDFPAAETRRFAAPGGGGFVLVLDDASRGFTTPGRSSLP